MAVIHDPPRPDTTVPTRLIGRECILAVTILVPLLIAAIVVPAIFLGPKLLAAGAFAGFGLMLMISLPLGLASMNDELEDEHG